MREGDPKMSAAALTSKPITVDRIEKCLDRLAQIMVASGAEGRAYLPIYERLESELEAMRDTDVKMSRIYARVRRSKDRTAVRSS